MKKFLTFTTLFTGFILVLAYHLFSYSFKAAVTVGQVNDSVVQYSIVEKFISYFSPLHIILATLIVVAVIWWKEIVSKFKELIPLFTIFIGLSLITSCGPAHVEKYVTIQPNETAYVIPVEGSTKLQQGFMSVQFLEAKKVATKRIYLPQRKISTGRMWWDYKWIPTVTIIKVDRSPVTREWTKDRESGTTSKDDALWVESSDSIGFGVGINLTAMILENDTSLYLYTFAGKTLQNIVDQNVRGRVNAILSREFAKFTLEQGRNKKNEIIDKVEKETTTYFKAMGITLSNIGLAEGLVYEDKEIQDRINANFVAQMDIQIKDNERLAQEKVNAKNISIADAEATAAEKFARAASDRKKQIDIEISLMNAKANLTMAQRWKGNMPANILPSSSPMLLNLGTSGK